MRHTRLVVIDVELRLQISKLQAGRVEESLLNEFRVEQHCLRIVTAMYLCAIFGGNIVRSVYVIRGSAFFIYTINSTREIGSLQLCNSSDNTIRITTQLPSLRPPRTPVLDTAAAVPDL